MDEYRRRLARDHDGVWERIIRNRQQAAQLRERLLELSDRGVRERRRALESRATRLMTLGPEQTLRRGYSICLDGADGSIVREAAQTDAGRAIAVVLSSGRLGATVDTVETSHA